MTAAALAIPHAAEAPPPLAGPLPVDRAAEAIVVTYTAYVGPQPGWPTRPRPWRRPTWLVASGHVRPASLVDAILQQLERHANQVRVHAWKDGTAALHRLDGRKLGPPLAFVDGMSPAALQAGLDAQPGGD